MKQVIPHHVVLAYPNLELYAETSDYQLGAMTVQRKISMAFFSRKLCSIQQRYAITAKELLGTIVTLKEF